MLDIRRDIHSLTDFKKNTSQFIKAHPAFRGVGVTSSSISRTQQRFAPFSNIMNELKEPQVKRQFLLRNPPMRSEPRPQQRPKALNRVDMDFAKSIPILVAGELPGRVTRCGGDAHSVRRKCHIHRYRQQFLAIVGLMSGAIVFCCTFGSIVMTTSPLRCIMPKIGGLLLLQRSSAPFTLQPTAAPGPLFLTSSGLPLCPATT